MPFSAFLTGGHSAFIRTWVKEGLLLLKAVNSIFEPLRLLEIASAELKSALL